MEPTEVINEQLTSSDNSASQPSPQPINTTNFLPNKRPKIWWKLAIIFLLLLGIGCFYFFVLRQKIDIPNLIIGGPVKGVEKFKSAEDFKQYLAAASQKFGEGYFGFSGSQINSVGRGEVMMAPQAGSVSSMEGVSNLALPSSASDSGSSRYSETNVQVAGIDEPDIIKSNGKEIYLSANSLWAKINIHNGPAVQRTPGTVSIKGFPLSEVRAENISLTADRQGQLLLYKNRLMVLNEDGFFAYDTSDSKKPKEIWQIKLKDRDALVAARLYADKLFLVTRIMVNEDMSSCSIQPIVIDNREITINCFDIYHPKEILPIDTVFNVFKIDVNSGQLDKTTSFLGSSGSSIVYMSPDAVYVTYSYPGDIIGFYAGFLSQNKDLFTDTVVEKINKLQTLDISLAAKMTELGSVLEKYQQNLGNDERLRFENEMENRMETYFKENKRELEKTGIVKISENSLEVVATGSVPGQLLNQFALDEYGDYLRVATTFGGGWWGGSSSNSASDVYVLDKNLNTSGVVRDLGETERIYSVRFIGDQGYVVTFRQTDPFYVLDLKNPKDPKLAGELKIPGYSSYLHPLEKNIILGVGMEGGSVKLSLFDVSDPKNPKEQNKYSMEESWSEALNNHHAFLQDSRHKVFFIPGSRGAYIFSYDNHVLKLVKAVSNEELTPGWRGKNYYSEYEANQGIKRFVYIEDFLYIVTDSKMLVFDEKKWDKVLELDLVVNISDEAQQIISQYERDAWRVNDVMRVKTYLDNHFKDNYPKVSSPIVLGDDNYKILCNCGSIIGFANQCSDNETSTTEIDNCYMLYGGVPKNPEPGGTPYTYFSDGKTYTLTFTLERGVYRYMPGLDYYEVGDLTAGFHTASQEDVIK